MTENTVTYSYQLTIHRYTDGDSWRVTKAYKRPLSDADQVAVKVDPLLDSALTEYLCLHEDALIGSPSQGFPTLQSLINTFQGDEVLGGYACGSNEPGQEVAQVNLILTTHRQIEYRKVDIDLKWSLWSQDVETFRERAGDDIVVAMRQAFDGTGDPVKVNTSPAREIRFGCVEIEKGCMRYEFYAEWDNAEALADTLIQKRVHSENWMLTEDEYQALHQRLSRLIADWTQDLFKGFECWVITEEPIGAYRAGVVTRRSFEHSLALVDVAEEQMLEQEEENFKALEKVVTEFLDDWRTSNQR